MSTPASKSPRHPCRRARRQPKRRPIPSHRVVSCRFRGRNCRFDGRFLRVNSTFCHPSGRRCRFLSPISTSHVAHVLGRPDKQQCARISVPLRPFVSLLGPEMSLSCALLTHKRHLPTPHCPLLSSHRQEVSPCPTPRRGPPRAPRLPSSRLNSGAPGTSAYVHPRLRPNPRSSSPEPRRGTHRGRVSMFTSLAGPCEQTQLAGNPAGTHRARRHVRGQSACAHPHGERWGTAAPSDVRASQGPRQRGRRRRAARSQKEECTGNAAGVTPRRGGASPVNRPPRPRQPGRSVQVRLRRARASRST